MNLRKGATVLAALALTLSLFGAGISATYTDSATAQVSALYVGTFACQLSTTTPGAVVSDGGHTVTYTEPPITVSAPPNGGNALDLSITLTNMGSIDQHVHWTVTGPDYNIAPYNRPPWNSPNGHFSTAAISPADIDPFAGGASHLYQNLGFMWLTPLDNTDLGVTLTATYHVDCTEHVVSASHVSFVGFANALGHAALTLPAGSQPGDLAVVMTYGPSSSPYAGNPTGYTGVNSTVANRTYLSYRVLQAGDTAVPATTAGTGKSVAVYRGATGIGANTYAGTSSGLPPESNYYPLYAPQLGVANGQTLHKIDGSSWVGVMTYDSGNGTGDVRQMTFNKVLTTTPAPPTLDGPVTVNRSSGAAATNIGLADTNAGVATWDNGTLPMGGWVMPVSTTTHTTTTYSFEILSTP